MGFSKGGGLITRVLRGGSWNNNDNNCRAANRNRNNPNNRNNNIGFRVCIRSPLHFHAQRPGIVWFTDRTSVALKVLTAVLSQPDNPAAESSIERIKRLLRIVIFI